MSSGGTGIGIVCGKGGNGGLGGAGDGNRDAGGKLTKASTGDGASTESPGKESAQAAWMLGLGSGDDVGVESARKSGKRGQGDATRACTSTKPEALEP